MTEDSRLKSSIIRRVLVLAFVCLCAFLIYQYQLSRVKQYHITGSTMGTYYSVKLVSKTQSLEQVQELQAVIESRLKAINASMSTYQTDSELSQINALHSSEDIEVSDELAYVLKNALLVSRQSHGAFDITLGPLINLWGFGPKAVPERIPEQAEIELAKQQMGYQHLNLEKQAQSYVLNKNIPSTYIDLSAIAKGYGVDQLAKLLEQQGFEHFMVDIGGELRLKGLNLQQQAWRIAVNKPELAQSASQIKLALKDVAIATSGDYRNYFEVNGKRYSHTIDPISAFPINHSLVSATVVHEECMMADAYATALMVLGPDLGLEFAKEHKLAVVLISKSPDGFVVSKTEQIEPYLL